MKRSVVDSRESVASAERAPFVSVVVPIRNEERFIGQTLADLVSQDWDASRVEILVVDGDSTDGTCDVVRRMAARFPSIRLLHNPKRWSSAARNIGVAEAVGDVLLIVDAHCEIPDASYLRNLCDAFDRSGADAIGRPQPLDVTHANRLQKAIAVARSSRLGHHPASYIYSSDECYVPAHSVAVAYRREVFDKIGLFDDSFDACEDVEFNHRLDSAGLTCFFTPQVLVRYHPRNTLSGLFHQMVRYGQGRARLALKHPRTFSLSSFIPALFVLGLAVGFVGSWVDPRVAIVYASVLGLYAVLICLVCLQIVIRQPDQLSLMPWLPLVFPTIHVGAGWGILSEMVKYPIRALRIRWSQPDAGSHERIVRKPR